MEIVFTSSNFDDDQMPILRLSYIIKTVLKHLKALEIVRYIDILINAKHFLIDLFNLPKSL